MRENGPLGLWGGVLVTLVAVVAVAGFVLFERSPVERPAESPAAEPAPGSPHATAPDTPSGRDEGDESPAAASTQDVPPAGPAVAAPSTSSRPDATDSSARLDTRADGRTPKTVESAPSHAASSPNRVVAGENDRGGASGNASSLIAPAGPTTSATGRPAAGSASGAENETLTVLPSASGGGSASAPESSAQGAGSVTDPEGVSSSTESAPPARPRSGSSNPSRLNPGGQGDEPTSIPLVSMLVPEGRVAVGDLVTVLVTIQSGSNVGHTPFHVLFNPAVLRFVSATEGSFLASDGQPTAFFAAPTSDGASVVVGLSRLGPVGGVSGDGDLCQLTFEVVGPGQAGLAFSRAKVRSSKNAIVQAVFQPAHLTAG